MQKILYRIFWSLRSKLNKIVNFVLIPVYKLNPNNCPDFVLSGLEIANTKYRPSFYTLERIVNSIDNYNGSIVECGVYRGGTLLGMAQLLKKKKFKCKNIWSWFL